MSPITHRLFQQPWPEGEFRLFQLGFIVDDLVASAERWARVFGVGPFHLIPRLETSCTYRGTPSAIDMQIGVAQAGPVQIELIQQYCDRGSVYRELVDRGQSAFHQLCTVTPDYDAAAAHYTQLGYEPASEFDNHGQRVAYFDTLGDFGFFTEVVEQTPAFLEHVEDVSKTCAEWDGDDPVRLLTRDGYRTP